MAAPSSSSGVRVRIRQKGLSHELSAYLSTKTQSLSCLDGRQRHAFSGDWVLLKAGVVFDVMSPKDFSAMFEVVEDEGLTLTPADRATIENALGFGSTRSSDSLANQVVRLARCRVGEIVLDFPVPQWEELELRARKRGLPLDAYMQQILDRFLQDMWTRI